MSANEPWAVHFLLDSRPATVGDPVGDFLPHVSARMRDAGMQDLQMPVREHMIDVRLNDGEPAAAVHAEAGTVPTPNLDLVRTVARTHRATLAVGLRQVVSTRDGVDAVHAMVMGLCQYGPPSQVLWFPHQQRLLDVPSFLAAMDRPRNLWLAVHAEAEPIDPTRSRAWTAGLATIGVPELRLAGSSASPADLRTDLLSELGYTVTDRRLPELGKRIKVNKTWYEFTEGADATTGEPVLDLVADRGRDAAPRPSDGGQPRRRGWLRR